ncbi:MAG TPA: phosphate signaling complex protein PhoU [Spirochaetota bacterium]|nr:phosphate signaling complex protein PhoU [Spirochaetota bacterium]HPC40314.1 phosphate signaling complex protein PhoU [Spirochaetota bacterium]HPL18257.1 phosphate signaling complex protein PhoU [Spirochaetota bacterium]HQF07212.1 phosphate signaling complex protein PhoU [Spirochaetota bacterium]HQH96112.1 phosphate signaling complex protein PhoU [Spirochaetota bacterium]
MITHLEQELEAIKSKMFEMADLAIESIAKSVRALKDSDSHLAEQVIRDDSMLDDLEVEIDNECIRILVTRQPAAVHLRFVLAMLKINTDLERIGDLATNIANEAINLHGRPTLKPLVDIPRMADLAITMLRDVFTAITERKAEKAREIISRDRDIDTLNMQVYRELFTYMAENAHNISQALGLIMVSKALERIGDHITNIAERAIYYIEGVDIRHADE